METKFFNDFEFYTQLINSNENFAYSRYADGEVLLMLGNSVSVNTQAYQVDKWSSPDYLTNAGKSLLETLNHTEENYHYAISSKSDNIDDYNFLIQKINNKNITFANLWINANYQKMFNFYNSLKKDVILICNYRAKKENFPFNVNNIIPFPDDCVTYWENNSDNFINELFKNVDGVNNQTFFISAGPISEIIIHKLYENNPDNQYIDVGSSIDEFIHGHKTRPYMYIDTQYSKEISYF